MTGRTHLVVGLALGLMVGHLAGVQGVRLAALVSAGGIGGLLPDIDHPKSMISGWVPGSGLLRLGISHRGPTHTLLFVVAIFSCLMLPPLPLQVPFFVAMGLGAALHLVCDMATPQGVRLFMPFSLSAWHLLPGELLMLPGVAWMIETMTGAAAMMLAGAILIGVV